MPAQQIIRLCEQPVLMEGETDACVAKFQAGDELVRDVLYMYSGQLLPERRGMENTNCKMVCVYSPNGYCGKTTLAMTLAHIKGEKRELCILTLKSFRDGAAGREWYHFGCVVLLPDTRCGSRCQASVSDRSCQWI